MKIHPIANCFPALEGKDFDELVKDIKAHGLLHEIITLDGMILDGRNRERACTLAHVQPRYEKWKPRSKGDTPIAFVISVNLARWHLTQSQRAAIGAELANLPQGRPGKQKAPSGAISQTEAAKRVGSSRRSIQRATKVLKQDAKLHAEIKAGRKRLPVTKKVKPTEAERKQSLIDRAIAAAPSSTEEPNGSAPVLHTGEFSIGIDGVDGILDELSDELQDHGLEKLLAKLDAVVRDRAALSTERRLAVAKVLREYADLLDVPEAPLRGIGGAVG